MEIAFVSQYQLEMLDFAAEAGFDGLEIFVEDDSCVNLDRLSEDGIRTIAGEFARRNLKVSTICCSVNHLHHDPAVRARNNAYFEKAMGLCRLFGTDTVTGNAWSDYTLTPEENLPEFKRVFSRYAKVAEDLGVRIALENCPHFVGYPLPIGNMAYSPEMWEAMFDEVDSCALGLEFDPSHLYWLGIDYLAALEKFGSKVFAVHAKDTEILPESLKKCGILGKQLGKTSEWDAGWWRYRLPGMGQVDWSGMMRILAEHRFTGPVIIEHEDPVYDGPLRQQGLKMGLKFLRQFDGVLSGSAGG